MKIGYFADGPWSHLALDRLITDGHEIAFVTPRFDTQDPVLHDICKRSGIPWLLEENVNHDNFIRKAKSYECDVFVSMSFNQIIKPPLFDLCKHGFVNCHAGALPFYRGRNPINWAFINNERYIGVTAHFIDAGIDTGKIIKQDFIPITVTDNYGSILAKGYSQCAKTLCDAIKLLTLKEFSPIDQSNIDAIGFYCSRRIAGDEYIDWSRTSMEIHNFIRALARPGPGAHTRSKTHHLVIFSSELIAGAPLYIGMPGEIVGRDENGFVIKTGNSTLLIKEIFHAGEGLEPIFSETPVTLKIGNRVGLTYGDLIDFVFRKNESDQLKKNITVEASTSNSILTAEK